MKRRMQLITAFLLMLAMTVSGTYVFAGTSDSPGDVQDGLEVTEPAPDQSADLEVTPEPAAEPEAVEAAGGEDTEGAVDAAGAVDATDEVEAPAAAEGTAEAEAVTDAEEPGDVQTMMLANGIVSSAPVMNATTMMYNTTECDLGRILQYNGNSSYDCFPIKVSATGKLYVAASAYGANTSSVSVVLGTYDAVTGKINYSGSPGFLSAGQSKDNIGGIDVVAGNTYYIGVLSSSAGQIGVRPYMYSYETRTLPAGLIMLTPGYKGSVNDSAALFQIKPNKNGYIRVAATEYGYNTSSGYITLLNAGKKAISDRLWYYSGSKTSYVAFGVKKGVTYYLKVNNFAGSYDNQDVYGIQYKVFGSALRKNTIKKRATTLKRKGKFIATAMPATGKAGSHWYKFKVPKKQATQIRINMANVKSGKVKATVYCGKKKVASTTLYNGTVNTLKVTYSTSYGKAKKGTYYLKLSKSAKANGSYKIRYLK